MKKIFLLVLIIFSASFFIRCEEKKQEIKQKLNETKTNIHIDLNNEKNYDIYRKFLIEYFKKLSSVEHTTQKANRLINSVENQRGFLLKKIKKENIILDIDLKEIFTEYINIFSSESKIKLASEFAKKIDPILLADNILKNLKKYNDAKVGKLLEIMCINNELLILSVQSEMYLNNLDDIEKLMQKWVKRTNDKATKIFFQNEIQFLQKKKAGTDVWLRKKLDTFVDSFVKKIELATDDQKEEEFKKINREIINLIYDDSQSYNFGLRMEIFLDYKNNQRIKQKINEEIKNRGASEEEWSRLCDNTVENYRKFLNKIKNIDPVKFASEFDLKMKDYFEIRRDLLLEKIKSENIVLDIDVKELFKEFVDAASLTPEQAKKLHEKFAAIDPEAFFDFILKKVNANKTVEGPLKLIMLEFYVNIRYVYLILEFLEPHLNKFNVILEKWLKRTDDRSTKIFLKKEMQQWNYANNKKIDALWNILCEKLEKTINPLFLKIDSIIKKNGLTEQVLSVDIKEVRSCVEKETEKLKLEIASLDIFRYWDTFLDDKKKEQELEKKSKNKRIRVSPIFKKIKKKSVNKIRSSENYDGKHNCASLNWSLKRNGAVRA